MLQNKKTTTTFTDQGEFTALINMIYSTVPFKFDPLLVVERVVSEVMDRYMGWIVDGSNYFGEVADDIFDCVCDEIVDYLDSLDNLGNAGTDMLLGSQDFHQVVDVCVTNFYHRLRDIAGNSGLFSRQVWNVIALADKRGAIRFEFMVELHTTDTPLTGSRIDEWFQNPN